VPHVELSLSELHSGRRAPTKSSLDRWVAAVSGAAESGLIIDADAVIVALSGACQEMLGLDETAVGHGLLDGALQLLDFSIAGATLDQGEVGKIPPLLALSSGRLARGLVRVRCAQGACTLDAIAAPLHQGDTVVGSLTFFGQV
jgi:hypothetical protein